MGGNRIVLLDGREIPAGREVSTALAALEASEPHGHQAGIVYPEANGDLRVRVVSISWRGFIPACGGLTQVLGKALEGTTFADRLGLRLQGRRPRVILHFDAYRVPLELERRQGQVRQVHADFTAFVDESRRRRVGPVELDTIAAMQVGTFLVLNADGVRSRYGDADFSGLDGPAREILMHLQRLFQETIGLQAWDVVLYDWHPDGEGDVRVVFPHALPQDHVEPACGTGSVALAVALFESGEAADRLPATAHPSLLIESGGGPNLGGPDLTTVDLRLDEGRVIGASFHHDTVEITAEGELPEGELPG